MIGTMLSSSLEKITNVGVRGRSAKLFDSEREYDRAGVNIVIEYVLAITIFIALTGLLISGFSSTVDTSQENIAQIELKQASAEVAVAIEDADRMVADDGDEEVQILVELPDKVGAEEYFIRVDEDDNGVGNVTAETSFASDGGKIKIVEYNIGGNGIESVNATEGIAGGDVVVTTRDDEIVVRSR